MLERSYQKTILPLAHISQPEHKEHYDAGPM